LIIPYFIPIHILHIPQSTIVYDEHNNEIGEIISQEKYRHREVAIKNIPDFLKISLISIEDRRFYWHS
jgi:membrane peptidoglycan carboxypeptidase